MPAGVLGGADIPVCLSSPRAPTELNSLHASKPVPQTSFMLRRSFFAIVAIVLLATVAALLDVPIAHWSHAHALLDKGWTKHVAKLVKWLGDYRITLAAAALIIAFNHHRWRAA